MVSTTRTATADADEGISPRNKATFDKTVLGGLNNTINAMEMRADPDAQATVTDFLDFTEYLPSDIVRSLTLIGKLDENYADASTKVDELTTTWSKLPTLPPDNRPSSVQLRADISETLLRALSSRMYSHAEATRMAENINRHYNRAKTILSKLQTMLENLPTEEQKSPVATSRSPQLTRTPKPAVRVTDDGQKVRRQRVPKIIVPGEVLAPYELDFDAYDDDDSDGSTAPEQAESPTRPTTSRATPAVPSRIKIVNKTQKTPKPPKTPATVSVLSTATASSAKPVKVHYPGANSTSPIVLHPPPDGVLPGTADAPWMQLTAYEMAMLRKRMKKNASWSPSDTMIARELQRLGRGPEAYRTAKKKAEDEGLALSNNVLTIPADQLGSAALGEGAISVDVMTDGIPLSNRGVKLNEAKKLKHDAMGKQAAEEAEASHRKLAEMANLLKLGDMTPSREGSAPEGNGRAGGNSKSDGRAKTRTGNKRKRDAVDEPEAEAPLVADAAAGKPGKRVKTETPVPPPQLTVYPSSQPRSVTPIPPPSVPQSVTPVPVPIPPMSSGVSAKTSASPPASVPPTGSAITIPTKPPVQAQVTPTTIPAPALPGTREQPRRETRQEAAKKQNQAQPLPQQDKSAVQQVTGATTPKATSRGPTPAPGDVQLARRPASRGKAASQEPAPSLASDRPRRSSTARNTPAPEANPPRQPNKRSKRPAPGVVSTLSSGGSSAVGKRKAAPKRKARAPGPRRGKAAAVTVAAEQGQGQEAGDVEMEEVDDEGNPIDPEEPRYCLCNRVSFGTMILCENKDNCKVEWFHLECVGLTDAPARTTKWYCPDCRVLLNIGEKGEVNARGVKK